MIYWEINKSLKRFGRSEVDCTTHNISSVLFFVFFFLLHLVDVHTLTLSILFYFCVEMNGWLIFNLPICYPIFLLISWLLPFHQWTKIGITVVNNYSLFISHNRRIIRQLYLISLCVFTQRLKRNTSRYEIV